MFQRRRNENEKWAESKRLVGGKVVASAEIAKRRGHQKHVGVLGAVKSGYRRLGIATKLIEVLLEKAKKNGL